MGEKWEREREWRECGQEKMCVRERERAREREKWPARFILSRLLWMLNILGSFILYLALRVEGKQQLLNYLQHSRTKGGFASTVTLLSLSLSHTHTHTRTNTFSELTQCVKSERLDWRDSASRQAVWEKKSMFRNFAAKKLMSFHSTSTIGRRRRRKKRRNIFHLN